MAKLSQSKRIRSAQSPLNPAENKLSLAAGDSRALHLSGFCPRNMQRAGSCPRRPPRSTLAHLHLQFLSFHTLTVSGFLMQSARFVFRLPAFADPGGIKSIRSRLAHRSELLLETVCSSYLPKLNSQPQRARRDRENLFSRRVQCLEWPHRREPRHGQVSTAFLSSSSRLPPSSSGKTCNARDVAAGTGQAFY